MQMLAYTAQRYGDDPAVPIAVTELGVRRSAPGAATYLGDVLSVLDELGAEPRGVGVGARRAAVAVERVRPDGRARPPSARGRAQRRAGRAGRRLRELSPQAVRADSRRRTSSVPSAPATACRSGLRVEPVRATRTSCDASRIEPG